MFTLTTIPQKEGFRLKDQNGNNMGFIYAHAVDNVVEYMVMFADVDAIEFSGVDFRKRPRFVSVKAAEYYALAILAEVDYRKETKKSPYTLTV